MFHAGLQSPSSALVRTLSNTYILCTLITDKHQILFFITTALPTRTAKYEKILALSAVRNLTKEYCGRPRYEIQTFETYRFSHWT